MFRLNYCMYPQENVMIEMIVQLLTEYNYVDTISKWTDFSFELERFRCLKYFLESHSFLLPSSSSSATPLTRGSGPLFDC
jgi:hypothetical protein